MNLCIFTGRLTRDPEMTQTNSGKNVVDFSIAINEGKDANGQERVTFANCQAWDKTAESIEKFFVKGKPITVQARLKNERWTDDSTGQNRRAEKFVVERFNFVPSEGKGEVSEDEQAPSPVVTATRATRKPKAVTPAAPTNTGGFSAEEDDDIPF